MWPIQSPASIHEKALNRVKRYLLGTRKKGLLLTPDEDLARECYLDSNFARLWSHKDPKDPHCVRSQTGYVLKFAGAPVLWKSKFQREIDLSTMES